MIPKDHIVYLCLRNIKDMSCNFKVIQEHLFFRKITMIKKSACLKDGILSGDLNFFSFCFEEIFTSCVWVTLS